MKICTVCGREIELLRLKALPTATTCISCMKNKDVPRYYGIMPSESKMLGEIQIVDKETAEEFYSSTRTGRGSQLKG